MSEYPIEWSLKPEDVIWQMEWTPRDKYPDKPAKEEMFEEETALAHLLMNEVVFLNTAHWRKDWPEEARKQMVALVVCNDVFAWALADAEELPLAELETLYRMWLKDPVWGAAIWCIQKRNEMPQKPVADDIRKRGVWDLESMGLEPNRTDAQVHAMLGAAKAQASVEPETGS